MKKVTLISIFSILGLMGPLSLIQASNCCGGGARNVDLGGNIQPFEIPAVDKIVSVDGFKLKVNRVKWSIYTVRIKGGGVGQPIAFFKDKNTIICARRLPPLSPEITLRELASHHRSSYTSNLRIENIRTSFAVKGVKAIYAGRPNFLSQNVQFVRYYFQEKSGRILCFEVYPTAKSPNWADANQLIMNTLKI